MEATYSKNPASGSGRKLWLIPVVLLAVVAIGAGAYLMKSNGGGNAHAAGTERHTAEHSAADVHVEVIKPTKGVLERTTSQAGTALAFDAIDIRAEVSGYVKTLKVDINSEVQEKDLLLEIDVPELKARVEQARAAVTLAEAQKDQREAAIKSANADVKAVEAKIKAAGAKVSQDQAYLKFRKKQLDRFNDLLRTGSIEARLVDEQEDRYEAATDALTASREAVNAAMAQKEASIARVEQANADLEEAKAKIKVANSAKDHDEAMLSFAKIYAPFDGVITYRNERLAKGAFIRAAEGGSTTSPPLLTLQHIDTMRMVVPIPDRDVPYCRKGNLAIVTFDALPGKTFKFPVARTGESEDLQTKTMRAEIDIPNPLVTVGDRQVRLIKQGMYGNVTVILARKENALSISSACLVGKTEGNKAFVYVVRDGKARKVAIETGLDNGVLVEVLKGLEPDDQVVVSSSGGIDDGVAVSVTETDKPARAVSSH
ncbi:MAG TPA: efflux RND transporter periplasmic adaptor subunit [Gemmataceae bacterium]|jgi:RND family efflux transporter MFP subunit